MRLPGGGSKDEHHGSGCRDRTGAWWAKPNPMGWGSNEPRTVRPAGTRASSLSSVPEQHGSRMDRRGGLIRQDGTRERPSGEGPGRGRR